MSLSKRTWGRRLDRLPVPWVVGVCAVVGASMGWLAGQLVFWQGMVVFGGLLGVGAWLALSAESVLVPEVASTGAEKMVDEEMEHGSVLDEEPSAERHALDAEQSARSQNEDHALVTEGVPADERPPSASDDPLAMVEIPGGEFMMGSADDDEMAYDAEKPAHTVRLSGFECMVYPVTRRLWVDVMGSRPSRGWYPDGPDDERPANHVSWFDAIEFCNRLSERHGLVPCYEIDKDGKVSWVASKGYRLPTEAEWEYACRAGTATRWVHDGQEPGLEEYAWYDSNANGEPRPVGEKRANPWQLHDMHGNVFEWCWDWFARYPTSDETLIDPRGPDEEEQSSGKRVLRGGSFVDPARGLRCPDRVGSESPILGRDIGFRCVRGSGRRP